MISDTHGLLRPEAFHALEGSDLIIHAGDVGNPEILDRLRTICPVTAIRGNIDKGSWASQLPATARIAVGGTILYVIHDVNDLDLDPARAGMHIVISGHSHKPARTERAGVLYLNPGSAGPRRFQLPVMAARLDLRQGPWKAEFIDLLHAGSPQATAFS